MTTDILRYAFLINPRSINFNESRMTTLHLSHTVLHLRTCHPIPAWRPTFSPLRFPRPHHMCRDILNFNKLLHLEYLSRYDGRVWKIYSLHSPVDPEGD